MYQALYRKWRPKTFDDVVGQPHITTTLKNEVANNKLAHAYLFCGSRGTGKTSCARILAKAVNCKNPQNGNPCCECDICKGIENDSILDVTEIDAASNSGVDNIRELREEANYTPVSADYRVYIIDETHMLSTGAFNALLKIMEEPPAHVLFILATTEIHKVPATILSRCQRFDFRRIASDVIARQLLFISKEEKISLGEDAALLIAKLSDGGMRDAISLLDLCLSASDAEITETAVIEAVGLVSQSYLFDIADAIYKNKSEDALLILETLRERSIDYQRLCEQLIVFYRNVMVVKSVKDPAELIACLPDELLRYREFAKLLSMDQILSNLTSLQNTLGRISKTPQRRTELELGLIKMANPSLEGSTAALLARLEVLERNQRFGGNNPAAKDNNNAALTEQKQSGTNDLKPKKTLENASLPEPSAEDIEKAEVEPLESWSDILEVLADKNRALYGTLADSKAYVGGGLLLIDAGDSSFVEMVRGGSYAKETLRAAIEAVTGQKFRLGPYSKEKYLVKKDNVLKLDQLLTKATQLGVDVNVKE